MSDIKKIFNSYGLDLKNDFNNVSFDDLLHQNELYKKEHTQKELMSFAFTFCLPIGQKLFVSDINLFVSKFNLDIKFSLISDKICESLLIFPLETSYRTKFLMNFIRIYSDLTTDEMNEALTVFSPSFPFQLMFAPNKQELRNNLMFELETLLNDFSSDIALIDLFPLQTDLFDCIKNNSSQRTV